MRGDFSIGLPGTLALASILAISTSCATQPPPPAPVDQAARYAKPLGYIQWMASTERFRLVPLDDRHEQRPGSWLKWRVEALIAASEHEASRVRVEVQEQNVVLSGSMRDRQGADALIESIKSVRGVVHIVDLMTIEPR